MTVSERRLVAGVSMAWVCATIVTVGQGVPWGYLVAAGIGYAAYQCLRARFG